MYKRVLFFLFFSISKSIILQILLQLLHGLETVISSSRSKSETGSKTLTSWSGRPEIKRLPSCALCVVLLVTTTPRRRRRQKRGLLVSLQNCGKEELYRTSSSLLAADAKNKEKCGKKPAERRANISCRAFSVAKEEEEEEVEEEEEKLCRFVNRNRFVWLQLLQQSSASTTAFKKSLLATTTTTT